MNHLSNSIKGQKKILINKDTQKEEEVLFLYSNQINNNNENNINDNSQTSVCEFIIGEKLGEGTFGTVRLGTNRQTGEKVAIKILEKSKMTNIDDKTRLEREIKILKKIHHPNIVKLFCVIETDRQIFIIMEYIKGNEMFQYILVKKKLGEEEACNFFLQIINCIDYLSRIKVAHRDLKAENIIIEQKTKEIKLLDFGLSNTYSNSQLLTTACGSPVYAAPEMLEGKQYKGSTVDIWSAGIVLYYMLCGNFPFEDISNDKLYRKIIKGKFEIPKSLSKSVKDLINKILVVNPIRRINIKDIKKHPWVLKYIEKNKNLENIFKNIGLNIGKYVIPIDEDIVDEINKKYNVDKIEIRKSIIYNIVNDKSTLYYLMLYKKCKDGSKSIADMKSDLFQNYIKEKTNLLSTYNNDLTAVFNQRKNGPNEPNEKNKIISVNKKESNNDENEQIDLNDNINKPKMNESHSLENICINNENKNSSFINNNNNTNITKVQNRYISAQKLNGKRNKKFKQMNLNKKKYQFGDSNNLSLNYYTLKNDNIINKIEKKKVGVAESEKKKLVNMKKKLEKKKEQLNYSKNKTIREIKNINNKKGKYKEDLNKQKLVKINLNKSAEIKDVNNNNIIEKNFEKNEKLLNNNVEIIESEKKEELKNEQDQENHGVPELNYLSNEYKENKEENIYLSNEYKENEEEKVDNLEKGENEVKSINEEDEEMKKEKDKDNYIMNDNNNQKDKKEKNQNENLHISPNNNLEDLKIKNNRQVLSRDLKTKIANRKNKASSLIDKKENKIIKERINKTFYSNKNNNNKTKIELNKDKAKKDIKNNKAYTFNKFNNSNQFQHHKITSAIYKAPVKMVFNDANGNPRPRPNATNTNFIKKYKNKSVAFEKDCKNEINFENLNNYSKNTSNIKKNAFVIKSKLNKNNKKGRIASSVKSIDNKIHNQ